jgi:hypothetical protein
MQNHLGVANKGQVATSGRIRLAALATFLVLGSQSCQEPFMLFKFFGYWDGQLFSLTAYVRFHAGATSFGSRGRGL